MRSETSFAHLYGVAPRDETELAAVDDDLASGSSVVVIGDAGVGKTRLSRAAAQRAEDRGWRVDTEATSGGSALVADAAGNSILTARVNGAIDWLAILTPPLVEEPAADDDYRVLFSIGDLPCYVQPVPTSVATAPDGSSVFVGELTGVTGLSAEGGPLYETGLSRVWRIDADAEHAVCSEGDSDDCEVAIQGLTSVIDVAFGPDGRLYVAEFDTAGWLAGSAGVGSGGAVLACDVSGTLPIDRDDCDEVVSPTGALVDAITFDKWGGLWVLENGLFDPEVRRISE